MRVTRKPRATRLDDAALILQLEASNPGVITHGIIAASFGIDAERSVGILLGALMASRLRKDIREYFAEAEAIVRCYAARRGER